MLGSLWRGECSRIDEYSENLFRASATLGISLIALLVHADHHKDIRAYLPSDLLLPDLPLADALAEELRLEVPELSVIIVFSERSRVAGPRGASAFTLLAEAYYAKLNVQFVLGNLSLLVWGLRSFALHLAVPEAMQHQVLCDLLDAPRALSQAAFRNYLRQLDPDFRVYLPDPALSSTLGHRGGRDWFNLLLTSFAQAVIAEQDFHDQHE